MPTEESVWEILEGAAVTTTTTPTLINAGSTLTPGARRTLTHPDLDGNGAPVFPVVTYDRNPDRDINFYQQPLYPPSADLIRTLGRTLPFISENALDDVPVTEIWLARGNVASMLASQFLRIYELAINPPEPDDPEKFIQWAPADQTTTVYNVVIVGLRVGGQNFKLDVKSIGEEQLAGIDEVSTGLIDQTVELDLLIVSEVS